MHHLRRRRAPAAPREDGPPSLPPPQPPLVHPPGTCSPHPPQLLSNWLTLCTHAAPLIRQASASPSVAGANFKRSGRLADAFARCGHAKPLQDRIYSFYYMYVLIPSPRAAGESSFHILNMKSSPATTTPSCKASRSTPAFSNNLLEVLPAVPFPDRQRSFFHPAYPQLGVGRGGRSTAGG